MLTTGISIIRRMKHESIAYIIWSRRITLHLHKSINPLQSLMVMYMCAIIASPDTTSILPCCSAGSNLRWKLRHVVWWCHVVWRRLGSSAHAVFVDHDNYSDHVCSSIGVLYVRHSDAIVCATVCLQHSTVSWSFGVRKGISLIKTYSTDTRAQWSLHNSGTHTCADANTPLHKRMSTVHELERAANTQAQPHYLWQI